jgi:hypothetical protein
MGNSQKFHRDELICWADLIESADAHSKAVAAVKDNVKWAFEEIAGFYGDQWFAYRAKTRCLPAAILHEFFLSGPASIAGLLERAARISLLPQEVRAQLTDGTNGIRNSKILSDFDHLEIVLEIIGLAVRAGWQIECEVPTSRGNYPDVRLTRGTMSYVIEVTVQGSNRKSRELDVQCSRLIDVQHNIENKHRVHCTIKLMRVISEQEYEKFVVELDKMAKICATSQKYVSFDFGFASAVVYSTAQRLNGQRIFQGPQLNDDLWPRFAERLRTKARHTIDAGLTWIRIEDHAGLLLFTPAGQMSIDNQLRLLQDNVAKELRDFDHVRGVIISDGAGIDPLHDQPELNVVDEATQAVAVVSQRPGGKRRRTFVIPIKRSSLLLPSSDLALDADRWYKEERGWLDWALITLGRPFSIHLIADELKHH